MFNSVIRKHTMTFPFKAKLLDQRYGNIVYMITVKNQKDWDNIKSLEETGFIKVELLKTRKQVLAK
jgi:hypothetical protein